MAAPNWIVRRETGGSADRIWFNKRKTKNRFTSKQEPSRIKRGAGLFRIMLQFARQADRAFASCVICPSCHCAAGVRHCPKPQISGYLPLVPPSREGRFAIVTDVGCGMRWTLWRRKTSGADADGEAVWS